MKKALAAAFVALTLITLMAPVMAASRPIVLVFDTVKGEGADKELAAATTKALRMYFGQTGRVDAVAFEQDNAKVLSAIMDKQLTPDKVASYASRAERLQVAQVLSYQYAAGAEISIKETMVQVKMWVAKVRGGKRDSWEATESAMSGGGGVRDIDNAMQSASSAVVLSIGRIAFKDLTYTAPDESAFRGPDSSNIAPPVEKLPTATEIATKADDSLRSGNVALAIDQYTQAISADPVNGGLRIKLAEAYARKGMYQQADEELNKAKASGADAKAVSDAKSRIDALQRGEQIDMPAATGAKPDSPAPATAPLDAARAAVAKMVEGDKFALQGKPDEAAEAYKESIRLNPGDWRAYHRLVMVDVSMSLFNEALKVLQQLKVAQPEPSPQLIASRYEIFRKGFDRHFSSMTERYDADAADFKSRKILRESYYSSMKGLASRLDSMTLFMEAIPLPPGKAPATQHRLLACGLLAQASSSILDYLETNDSGAKQSADVFTARARKEIELANKLDATPPPAAE